MGPLISEELTLGETESQEGLKTQDGEWEPHKMQRLLSGHLYLKPAGVLDAGSSKAKSHLNPVLTGWGSGSLKSAWDPICRDKVNLDRSLRNTGLIQPHFIKDRQ